MFKKGLIQRTKSWRTERIPGFVEPFVRTAGRAATRAKIPTEIRQQPGRERRGDLLVKGLLIGPHGVGFLWRHQQADRPCRKPAPQFGVSLEKRSEICRAPL